MRSDKFESAVRVVFTPSGGSPVTRELGVPRTFANALPYGHAGKEVTMRYLPHDQQVADIAGASAASGWSALSTVALFGLAVWVLWRTLRAQD